MAEAIAARSPSGAGRSVDWVWPIVSDAWGSLNAGSRGGVKLGVNADVTGSGSTGTKAVWRGAAGQLLRNFLATDRAGINLDPLAFLSFWSDPTAPAFPNGSIETQVWEFGALMSSSGQLPAASQDLGLELTWAGNGLNYMFLNAEKGVGLQIADLHTVNFVSRDGAGLVITPLTAAPFDASQWHDYRMRITLASATAGPSQLSVFIDGVLQTLPATQSSWAAGTRLPLDQLSGTSQTGWRPVLINHAGIAQDNSLIVHRAYLHAAPTVLDLA